MEFKKIIERKVIVNLDYSLRRYYVDKYFFETINMVNAGSKILDMGGKKKNKRGVFNIEEYNFTVKYANIDAVTEPDFFCDISSIPVDDNIFDCVILSEVLEHLPEPLIVLSEAYRILKPGGKLLMVTPFMYHVHADPYDYARYTDYWYKQNLKNIGYKNIHIEKQGLFFSVMANQLKTCAYELSKIGLPGGLIKRKLFYKFTGWFIKKAILWDESDLINKSAVFKNTTTGYGVICEK